MTAAPWHFLLAPVGSHGDVLPACGLARELAALGHSVELVAEALYRPVVEQKGIPFRGFGDPASARRLLADPRLWTGGGTFMIETLLSSSIRPQFDAVEAAVSRHGKRVVVLTSAHAAGPLWAAQHFGLRSVGLVSSPPLLMLNLTDDLQSDIAFRAAFHASGLPALPSAATDAGRRFYGDYMLSFDHLLEMFPRWFDTRPKPRPANCVEGTFPLEGAEEVVEAVQSFAENGPAPWVFFPGTGGALTAARPDFLALAEEVVLRTGRRAILVDRSLGERFQLRSPRIATTPSTNFPRLLPLARGLFHHGGIGATSLALAHALPQVVVPVAFDQPGNAYWVEHAGCGLRCRPDALDVSRITRLLEDAEALPQVPLQAVAARIAEEGAAGGLAQRLLAALDAREAAAPARGASA